MWLQRPTLFCLCPVHGRVEYDEMTAGCSHIRGYEMWGCGESPCFHLQHDFEPLTAQELPSPDEDSEEYWAEEDDVVAHQWEDADWEAYWEDLEDYDWGRNQE